MILLKKEKFKYRNLIGKGMSKWTELLLGLVLVIVPVIIAFYSQPNYWGWGYWNLWNAAGIVLMGGIFWMVILVGVLFILMGISGLKG